MKESEEGKGNEEQKRISKNKKEREKNGQFVRSLRTDSGTVFIGVRKKR